jgi:hypothetical protein
MLNKKLLAAVGVAGALLIGATTDASADPWRGPIYRPPVVVAPPAPVYRVPVVVPAPRVVVVPAPVYGPVYAPPVYRGVYWRHPHWHHPYGYRW